MTDFQVHIWRWNGTWRFAIRDYDRKVIATSSDKQPKGYSTLHVAMDALRLELQRLTLEAQQPAK